MSKDYDEKRIMDGIADIEEDETIEITYSDKKEFEMQEGENSSVVNIAVFNEIKQNKPSELEKEITKKNAKKIELEEEIEMLIADRDNLSNEINLLENQKEALDGSINCKNDSIDKLESQIDELDKKRLSIQKIVNQPIAVAETTFGDVVSANTKLSKTIYNDINNASKQIQDAVYNDLNKTLEKFQGQLQNTYGNIQEALNKQQNDIYNRVVDVHNMYDTINIGNIAQLAQDLEKLYNDLYRLGGNDEKLCSVIDSLAGINKYVQVNFVSAFDMEQIIPEIGERYNPNLHVALTMENASNSVVSRVVAIGYKKDSAMFVRQAIVETEKA